MSRPVDTYELFSALYELAPVQSEADLAELADICWTVAERLDRFTYDRLTRLLTGAHAARAAWERSERLPGVFARPARPPR